MSLQEKVINLKLEAALAVKHAQGWQRLIDLYGEEKATAFYTHLGLNHLGTKRVRCQGCDGKWRSCARCGGDGYIGVDAKSFDFEGLKLSREPKEHEKIAVKGIANAQESAKETIGNVLLLARNELIADGLKGIKKLKPATYHELTLQVSSESRQSLRGRLVNVHRQGRLLVAAELGTKEAVPDDEFDALDELTDLTDSRIANDVQARIIAAATRFRLLGLTGAVLLNAITNEINAGSVSYIDRAAQGLANKVINIGRMDEAEHRRDEWGRVEYSALLDQNVCGPCASEDGDTANNEADLTPVPNPECQGGDWCRCFWVYVQN